MKGGGGEVKSGIRPSLPDSSFLFISHRTAEGERSQLLGPAYEGSRPEAGLRAEAVERQV